MKRLIVDEETANRIANIAKVTGGLDAEAKVFSYQQHRTGLTLFAVELVTPDGKTEIVTTQ